MPNAPKRRRDYIRNMRKHYTEQSGCMWCGAPECGGPTQDEYCSDACLQADMDLCASEMELMIVWQPGFAEDLEQGDVFRFADEPEILAHTVSTPVTPYLDAWVKFCTHLRYSDSPEGLSVVEGNTDVLIWKET